MLLTKKFVESVIERNIADDRMTTFSGTIKYPKTEVSFQIYTSAHDKFLDNGEIEYEEYLEIFDSEPFAVATLPLEEFVGYLNEVLETLTEAR